MQIHVVFWHVSEIKNINFQIYLAKSFKLIKRLNDGRKEHNIIFI